MSKLNYKLKVTLDNECPNSVYGIWEQADNHQGGVTIKFQSCTYQSAPSYWVNTQYSLADLTKDYAKQGRENPSKEAYESLQKELEHYLEGDMMTITAQIWLEDDILLAEDSIGTDFSYNYWDSQEECAEECARENFSIYSLVREARKNARELQLKLAEAC